MLVEKRHLALLVGLVGISFIVVALTVAAIVRSSDTTTAAGAVIDGTGMASTSPDGDGDGLKASTQSRSDETTEPSRTTEPSEATQTAEPAPPTVAPGSPSVPPPQLPAPSSSSNTPPTTAPTTTAPTTAPSETSPPETTAPATPEPTATQPTTEGTAAPAIAGDPSPEAWAALRQCEASGSHVISSANGLYHGAYEFDQRTWDGVEARVGRSDLVGVKPSDAAPAEQDVLTLALYRDRGAAPWASCGRQHLP